MNATALAPKPKLGRTMKELHGTLVDLAGEYRKVGERHASDAEVYHTAQILAKQCEHQAEALRPHADRHGKELPQGVDEEPRRSLLEPLRRAASQVVGRTTVSGMLLLRDLRQLHLSIAEAAMLWIIVGQGAQAARDPDLLRVVDDCHEQIGHQLMWVTTTIKQTAPQVLTT